MFISLFAFLRNCISSPSISSSKFSKTFPHLEGENISSPKCAKNGLILEGSSMKAILVGYAIKRGLEIHKSLYVFLWSSGDSLNRPINSLK